MVLPGSYPHYLDLIHSLSVGPFLIGLAKFGIAFPVSYHTLNGIRHLVRASDNEQPDLLLMPGCLQSGMLLLNVVNIFWGPFI